MNVTVRGFPRAQSVLNGSMQEPLGPKEAVLFVLTEPYSSIYGHLFKTMVLNVFLRQLSTLTPQLIKNQINLAYSMQDL